MFIRAALACFAALTAALPLVTITSTFNRTKSRAFSTNRSLLPSAQRYSIATVRPSIHPCSRIRWTNAAVQVLWADCDSEPRNPTTGIAGSCARTPSGHATAPPTSAR